MNGEVESNYKEDVRPDIIYVIQTRYPGHVLRDGLTAKFDAEYGHCAFTRKRTGFSVFSVVVRFQICLVI